MTLTDSFNILYDRMFDLGYADDDITNMMHMTIKDVLETRTPIQDNVLAFLFCEQQSSGHGISSNFWIDVRVIARVTDYVETEVRVAIRELVDNGILYVSPYVNDDIRTDFRTLNARFTDSFLRKA